MVRLIRIVFISLLVLGNMTNAFALSSQKINRSGANQSPQNLKIAVPQWGKYVTQGSKQLPQNLKIAVPQWGKYSVPQAPEQEAAFKNVRTKGYDVASNPMTFEPRKSLTSNPLMPARDRGKLN